MFFFFQFYAAAKKMLVLLVLGLYKTALSSVLNGLSIDKLGFPWSRNVPAFYMPKIANSAPLILPNMVRTSKNYNAVIFNSAC